LSRGSRIRRLFIKLHEAGHGTLPHQAKVYRLIHDCEKTLDAEITDLFEREAMYYCLLTVPSPLVVDA
jgi:hypothetical protein